MEYGWPLPKRLNLFDELSKTSPRETFRITFQERSQVLPVYRIPIELPKYRLFNGRTATLQEEWLALNEGYEEDFFTKDPERLEAQRIQHQLLSKLVDGAGLLATFKAGQKQEDYIILDAKGFVINGNRRLCAWRELYHSDISKFEHFSYIDVVVLPESDDKSIDKLEAKLQVERDIKDDYSWHAQALMMQQRKVHHDLSDRELAEFYDLREVDIRQSLEMLEYAQKWLESKGKPKQWSLVTDKYYAFEAIVKNRKKLTNVNDTKLFEDASFVLLDDPKDGRLYDLIPGMFRYFAKAKEKLFEEFESELENTEEQTDNLNDLFGGISKGEGNEVELGRVISVEENREKAAEVIRDTVETEKSLEKDKDTANYVLKKIKQANANIQSANLGKSADSNTKGLLQQIQAIEQGLQGLRNWLDSKDA